MQIFLILATPQLSPLFLVSAADRTRKVSRNRKTMGDTPKDMLIRICRRKQEPDTAGILENHGTGLKQLYTDGADLSASEFCAFKRQPPNCFY